LALKKTHWNRGRAPEAALTSMRLGFDQFGLSRRVAIINPDNSASRRVAQKLGLVEERHLIHEGEPIVVYRAAPGCSRTRRKRGAVLSSALRRHFRLRLRGMRARGVSRSA
jgi:RimJ/RimL family protein N-acetyltransferase